MQKDAEPAKYRLTLAAAKRKMILKVIFQGIEPKAQGRKNFQAHAVSAEGFGF